MLSFATVYERNWRLDIYLPDRYPQKPRIDKSLDFPPYALGPTLMVRGSNPNFCWKKIFFGVVCGVLGEKYTLGWKPPLLVTHKISVRMGCS